MPSSPHPNAHTHTRPNAEKVTESTVPTILLTYFCLKLSTSCEVSSSGMKSRKTHILPACGLTPHHFGFKPRCLSTMTA